MTNAGNSGSLVVPPEENFDTPAMQGSLQQFLADNLGEYVVVEFLIGTNAITRKQGVLYAVGRSVLTLYEETPPARPPCPVPSSPERLPCPAWAGPPSPTPPL